MLNSKGMEKLQGERLKNFPNVDSLMKISLGLILFTVIATAFVYAETITVDVEGTSYDVDYSGNVEVTGIEADTDFISLILTVDVSASPGTLDITFERSFFDSTFEGLDDDFIILADGDEPNFSETATTAQSRTLSIELPAGTEEVEIIGSVFGQEVVEEPVEEEVPEPVEEEVPEPVEEETPEPVEDTPRTECGPGTVLQDGVCVLDERCGPGTILQDGVCVLVESTPAPSGGISVETGSGKELIIGVVAAFIVAGAVGIILAIISRASKRRD